MYELDNCCGTTCDKQLLRSEIAALQKDRGERAELAVRLHNEVSLKQLEIDHCHAVCDELRQKLDGMAAQVEALKQPLQAMVNLMTSGEECGEGSQWYNSAVTALAATTEHHLHQVRADAGRDGYIAASLSWMGLKNPDGINFPDADRYPTSILAGKDVE